jgi:hypothetical protein
MLGLEGARAGRLRWLAWTALSRVSLTPPRRSRWRAGAAVVLMLAVCVGRALDAVDEALAAAVLSLTLNACALGKPECIPSRKPS